MSRCNTANIFGIEGKTKQIILYIRLMKAWALHLGSWERCNILLEDHVMDVIILHWSMDTCQHTEHRLMNNSVTSVNSNRQELKSNCRRPTAYGAEDKPLPSSRKRNNGDIAVAYAV
jgi:hypothetical protein